MTIEFADAIGRLAVRADETPEEAAEELQRQEANERRRSIAVALHKRALWGGERISAEMAALPPKERAEHLHSLRRRCLEDGPDGHDAEAVATHAALVLLLDRTIRDAEKAEAARIHRERGESAGLMGHKARWGARASARRAAISKLQTAVAEIMRGRRHDPRWLRRKLLTDAPYHEQFAHLFANERQLADWAKSRPELVDLNLF